jgi:hypothetical protein
LTEFLAIERELQREGEKLPLTDEERAMLVSELMALDAALSLLDRFATPSSALREHWGNNCVPFDSTSLN